MTEPLLYRPTEEEERAFLIAWAREESTNVAMVLAYNQAQRTGKTAFTCYLAIVRSL